MGHTSGHVTRVEIDRVWHEVPGGLQPAYTNSFGGTFDSRERPDFRVGDCITLERRTTVDLGRGDETSRSYYYFKIVSTRVENNETHIMIKELV